MRPVLPFPLPLALGTDICRVSRVASILSHPTRGPRFVERVLSPEERSLPRVRGVLARKLTDGAVAEFIAGRFAAKEAAFKAHPSHHLGFHDIVIRSSGTESGPIAAIIRDQGEVDFTALVSISHDGGFAVGVCLGGAPTPQMSGEPEKGGE
ncbi:related to phosphopantetheine protein transferase [Cephalotrichum gorgonifer]|uniref:Related to phosphopantetheine protein transferase n=1 Tax=Cephalotrichum gorgonifer TaxID=2041049 RepID=A0AAE8MSI2_9PEZI|nr:related to phosphopantetheine protein transferase [Cephalotrichum gorgonifer]